MADLTNDQITAGAAVLDLDKLEALARSFCADCVTIEMSMNPAAVLDLIALARRAAQPAEGAGQAGQVAKPELTVWYGPMPESNGKSNFTAILMRKGGDQWDNMTDGITIDRSEYPDRVRYEADRVRYLLGELAERPFILDYDADKHSGYVAPSERAAAPAEQPSAQVKP